MHAHTHASTWTWTRTRTLTHMGIRVHTRTKPRGDRNKASSRETLYRIYINLSILLPHKSPDMTCYSFSSSSPFPSFPSWHPTQPPLQPAENDTRLEETPLAHEQESSRTHRRRPSRPRPSAAARGVRDPAPPRTCCRSLQIFQVRLCNRRPCNPRDELGFHTSESVKYECLRQRRPREQTSTSGRGNFMSTLRGPGKTR